MSGSTHQAAVGRNRLIQPPPTRRCMPLRGAAPSRRGWENQFLPANHPCLRLVAQLQNWVLITPPRWHDAPLPVRPLPAAGFVEPPGPPPPDGPPKAVHLQPLQAEGGECPQFFLGLLPGGNARNFSPRRFFIRSGTIIMCIFFPHTLGGIMCIFSFLLPHASLLTESCPTLGLTFSFVL